MIKRSKRFISSILGSCLIISMIPMINVNAQGVKAKVPSINPKVQSLDVLGEGFQITSTVNIVGQTEAYASAVSFLEEILSANGISVATEYNSANTTIVLGEFTGTDADATVQEAINFIGESEDIALTKDEGYVLHTSNDSEANGLIVIGGKDNDGTFYGVSTFKQLLEKNTERMIPEVSVSDYSEIKFRGIVEGFYGDQWSHEGRKELLELGGEYKFNSYIYGPKDDPYHKDKWRDPYPEAEAKKLQDLVNTANENNVDFVWAIHPGGSITFTEQDYEDLLNKCELMYDLGVRSFAVFFDDISGPGTDANKQAEFLNRLNADLVKAKGDVTPLIMCPTEYNKWWANHNPGTYLDILGDKLDQDINIMWTGDRVMSDIDKASLEWVNNRVNRDVYVWWNFPVNDYCRDRLLLGEAYGLANDVDNASGFVSNPMNHAYASKLGLYSVADYSWNVDAYDSTESWNNAIEDLVPEVAESFKVFAIHNADAYTDYHQYRRNESEHLKPTLEAYKTKVQDGDVTKEAQRLITEFEAIERAGADILANLKDEGMLNEIELWAQAFEQLGKAGRGTINSITALKNGDLETWWNNYVVAEKALAEMKRIDSENRQNQTQPGVKVATNAVTPFVKEMFKLSETLYYNSIYTEDDTKYEISPITSFTSQSGIDKMVDGDESTYYYAQELLEVGDYYGIDLGKTIKINDVKILQGRNDTDHDIMHRGILEYSVDGENWTAIGEERSGNLIEATNLDVEARYIRYKATFAGVPGGKPDVWTAVREFSINNTAGNKVYTNIENVNLNISSDDEKLFFNTTDLTLNNSSYLGFETEKLSRFDGAALNFAGGYENLTLEYSINGIEWNELASEVVDGTLKTTNDFIAKYVRVINNGEVVTGGLNSFELYKRVEILPTATTTASIYQGDGSKLVDGDKDSFLWTREQREGQYYEVDLGQLTTLHDITIYSHNNDYVRSGILEVSKDRENWTVLNDFSAIPQRDCDTPERLKNAYNEVKGDAKGDEYRYIRLRVTGDSNMWSKIYEIAYNETIKEETLSFVETSFDGNVEQIVDDMLDTSYVSEREAVAGDYINYKLTSINNIDSIHILQDDESISANATVSVRTNANEWIELGNLDSAFNNLAVKGVIPNGAKVLDIKISWAEGGIAPKIYEINEIFGEETNNLLSVTASADKVSLNVGETSNISVTGLLEDGTNANLAGADIVYTSSDANILSVNEEGIVTAVASGSANITASVTLNGVTIASNEVSITVEDTDTGKPEITPNKVENLDATSTADSVTLTWSEPTNAKVTGYTVYKDGKVFMETTDTQITVDGLKANSIYNFKVVANGVDDLKSRPASKSIRTKKVESKNIIENVVDSVKNLFN